jgi:Trk K+ transport system NAD-binding subunit
MHPARAPDDALGGAAGRSDDDRPTVVIVGDQISAGMADRLAEDFDVLLVTDDDAVLGTARSQGVDTAGGDATDGAFLRGAVADADAAVVATERDRTNLLVIQLLRTAVSIDRIVVRLNDPTKRDAFENIDVDLIDGSSILAAEVGKTLAPGEP